MLRIVSIVTAMALLAAIAPWPYGYYQLLRVVVFLAGLYCGALLRQSADPAQQKLSWALFGAALVFNPFLPVYLPREVWMVVDVVAAGLFGFAAFKHRSSDVVPR